MIEFMKIFSPVRIITFALTGTCMYMWITGQPIDELLRYSWLLLIGYWFKSEVDKK